MKTSFKNLLRIAAAVAIPSIAAVATASASQQNNQLALHLGAIQLGYTTNSTWYTNSQLLANALTQGQEALLAKTTNAYPVYVVTGTNAATNAPLAQTANFRQELFQATLAALTNPVINTNKYTGVSTIKVTLYNPKTKTLRTNSITSFGLNPVLTTPGAVLSIATARVPDLAPGLVSTAVASSVSYATNTNGIVLPVWGAQPSVSAINAAIKNGTVFTLNQKTAATQIKNAGIAAKTALTAAVKTYVNGTTQWATFNKKTGPTNGVTYLPNYSTKNLGAATNPQIATIDALQDAAAAVAANAVNGLGAINTNTTITNTVALYGKSATNVTTLAKSLAAAAAGFQKTSATTVNGVIPNSGGAEAATAFGLITQVAGTNSTDIESSWSADATKAILNGVVIGAVSGSRANAISIAYGVAEGFTAAYLQTYKDVHGSITGAISSTSFQTLNGSAILNAFVSITGLVTTKNNTAFTTAINNAFSNVYTAFSTNTTAAYGLLTGARGINMGATNGATPLINGVGTPVTDTVGLQ